MSNLEIFLCGIADEIPEDCELHIKIDSVPSVYIEFVIGNSGVSRWPLSTETIDENIVRCLDYLKANS